MITIKEQERLSRLESNRIKRENKKKAREERIKEKQRQNLINLDEDIIILNKS